MQLFDTHETGLTGGVHIIQDMASQGTPRGKITQDPSNTGNRAFPAESAHERPYRIRTTPLLEGGAARFRIPSEMVHIRGF